MPSGRRIGVESPLVSRSKEPLRGGGSVSHLELISPKKLDLVEKIETKQIGSALFGFTRASEFALSVAIAFAWATAALARSPLDDQHAQQIPPSGPALMVSGVSTIKTEVKTGVSGGSVDPKVEQPKCRFTLLRS